jgi:hypothetical protein
MKKLLFTELIIFLILVREILVQLWDLQKLWENGNISVSGDRI